MTELTFLFLILFLNSLSATLQGKNNLTGSNNKLAKKFENYQKNFWKDGFTFLINSELHP